MISSSHVSLFWGKVIRVKNGCWKWTARKHRQGYGVYKDGHKGKSYYAHRISWTLLVGPIPTGVKVLHKCDNTECSNPDHLFLGTQKDNMQDAERKGRMYHPKGSASHSAKLTDSDVLTILDMLECGVPGYSIAAMFNVSKIVIYRIRDNKTWSHLKKGEV